MTYDFNIKKMENKIQINTNKWLFPATNSIELYKLSGRSYVTYISEITAVGKGITNVCTGDSILLSKVSCDIATAPTSPYEVDGEKFYNIPYTQIMGKFKNNMRDFNSLEMLENKILFEKIERNSNSTLDISDSHTIIGKVLKVGNNCILKKGDLIIIVDNTSTPVRFNEKVYYASEERTVVGIFKDSSDLSIRNLKIINENILMKPYVSKNILNSSILETPEINYEDLDYSDINNRDLFRVEYVDENLNNIKEGEILLLNRDYTNYVYYDNEKYFIISGKKWISGKIKERD